MIEIISTLGIALRRTWLVWFGFEPVLSNLRNTPTQFFEYSYRRYLKGFGLSINSSNFGQCTVVRTDRIFRPILMVWYLHSN
jgi:hypothetical protein